MNTRELVRNEKIVAIDLVNSIESGGVPLDGIGIDAIGLSARSYNALKRNRIDSVHKLVHCSETDLFKIPNIGVSCVWEIKEKVNNYIENVLGNVENTDKTNISLPPRLEIQETEATQPLITNWNSLISDWINSVKGANKTRNIRIFQERYGLVSGQKETLEGLGSRYNLTRERVRQIAARFFVRLRHPSRQKMLSPFDSYFNNLLRKYGSIMTLKEITNYSKSSDELIDFFPMTTVDLILYFCKTINALVS